MKYYCSRLIYLLGFIAISFLLIAAFFLEKHLHLIPCPLCIFQRFIFAILGVVFFFGAALNLKKAGRILISFFSIFISAIGVLFAGRQAWIQHFPPSLSGDCGASLHYMLKVFPLDQVIKKVFIGGVDCAKVDWQFLDLSMADWALLCFILFLLVGCIEFVCAVKTKA